MRVGVIGVGRIGTFHAATLAGRLGTENVVVADVDEARAQAGAAAVGLIAVPLEDIFEAVDAVVITAATSAHAELIRRGIDAGRPVFCEKPITLDLETTRDVVDYVRRHRGTVQMGFQRRFDAGYTAARDLVASGGLGTLYIVRMTGHDPAPPHEEYIAHSGGIFRDFSVHDFDALRFVTGQEVTEVYADGAVVAFPVFEKYGDVDTAAALLKLDGGTIGVLSCTRHDPLGYDIRMECFGSADSVMVGWDDRTPLRSLEPGVPAPAGPAYANFQERFRPAYEAELETFLEVAAGRCSNPCPPEEAMVALEVAVACDISRAEHRPVRLKEVA